jgi:DNA-binding MarR family transcriptional regulator
MWEKVSFVRRGRLRKEILENLVQPNNPTDLAKRLHSHRPTVSSALSELLRASLVKRLNPGEKNISIYGLTPEGLKVLQTIRGMRKGIAADSDGKGNA